MNTPEPEDVGLGPIAPEPNPEPRYPSWMRQSPESPRAADVRQPQAEEEPGEAVPAAAAWQYPPPSVPLPTAYGVDRPTKRYSPVVLGLAVVVVVVILTIVLCILLFRSHPGSAGSTARSGVLPTPEGASQTSQVSTTGPPTSAPPTSPPASLPESDAADIARKVSNLLGTSSTMRQRVGVALSEVNDCSNPSEGAASLRDVADGRRSLVDQVNNLDDAVLPGGDSAVALLVSAWKNSAKSDDEYAAWADDSVNTCFERGRVATSNRHERAGARYSRAATADKKALVKQWNRLARRYGENDSWEASDV